MGFKVTVVGLGLMGGSLAKALRGWRGAEIIGVEKDLEVMALALADGAIDRAYQADEAARRAVKRRRDHSAASFGGPRFHRRIWRLRCSWLSLD